MTDKNIKAKPKAKAKVRAKKKLVTREDKEKEIDNMSMKELADRLKK